MHVDVRKWNLFLHISAAATATAITALTELVRHKKKNTKKWIIDDLERKMGNNKKNFVHSEIRERELIYVQNKNWLRVQKNKESKNHAWIK